MVFFPPDKDKDLAVTIELIKRNFYLKKSFQKPIALVNF